MNVIESYDWRMYYFLKNSKKYYYEWLSSKLIFLKKHLEQELFCGKENTIQQESQVTLISFQLKKTS